MSKSIIITGAAGNLGRAIAHKLADEGFHIEATLGPNDQPEVLQHKHISTSDLDLKDEQAVEQYVSQQAKANENIFAGILCVGGFGMGSIQDTGSEDITKMYNLNFLTAYNMVRPLLRVFEKQKFGRIFLIGARPALNPAEGKNLVAYALSKSLLFRLAEMVNDQYKSKEQDIVCSVIAPSILDTEINREAMPDMDHDGFVPPDRIADIVAYALSPAGLMLREPIFKIYNRV